MGLKLLRKTRDLKQRIGKKYDNEQFWIAFGENYYDKYKNKKDWVKQQESLLLPELKKLDFNSILEFGCGFGRLTKILAENFNLTKYDAFDISKGQIDNAKKYCSGHKINFSVGSIADFQSDFTYDLVLGPEILLHIEPKDIEFVIQKMSRFASKYFIQTGSPYNPHQKIHKATHTFYHDYESIYQRVGLPKAKIIPVNDINQIHILELNKSTI